MANRPTLTQARIKSILTDRLSLREPQFFLEKVGDRIVGDVVSPSFKGKRDHQRQQMLWDVLESELGPELSRQVGMLLAYTPDEWNIDGLTEVPARRKTTAGKPAARKQPARRAVARAHR